MIYISGPYSSEFDEIMEGRFNMLTDYAGKLMFEGHLVYSPITHNHPIATRVELPRGWDFWKKHDLAMIAKCSSLHVLTLLGWEESVGVAAEIVHAVELNIPVYYISP